MYELYGKFPWNLQIPARAEAQKLATLRFYTQRSIHIPCIKSN